VALADPVIFAPGFWLDQQSRLLEPLSRASIRKSPGQQKARREGRALQNSN
jgi:hypothetical protein